MLDGAVVIGSVAGNPNDSSNIIVTGAPVGTFFQPSDDPDKLYLKTGLPNQWILVNTTTEQVGAPAITSVSEALAFTWMGFGQ